MSFDPLSFFTPDTTDDKNEVDAEIQLLKDEAQSSVEENQLNATDYSEHDQLISPEEYDNEEEGLIHILDLPRIKKGIPRDVVLIILQLLKPEQETNFGAQTSSNNEEDVLQTKDIHQNTFLDVQSWLKENFYNKLSANLLNLRLSPEIFQYLNKILSSEVFQADDEILQLTSLRISENCGRTARPNFQRKIILKNFENNIYLNEPSLTSDSLGLKTWGSSLVLSEFIVENKDDLLISPILELGSGTGLVGITIGLLGYDVTLTDLPEILPNLIKNKELNEIDSDCLVLDWTNPKSFISEKGNVKFKTIVIADPIYSPDHPRYVVNMICTFLEKSDDARVLLQIPIRNKFEKEREYLWDLLKNSGLKVHEEKIMDGYDDFGAQKFIYKYIRWSE